MVPRTPRNPLVFSTLRAGITAAHSGTIDKGTDTPKLPRALSQELRIALKTLHAVLINPALHQTGISMFLRVKKFKNKLCRK